MNKEEEELDDDDDYDDDHDHDHDDHCLIFSFQQSQYVFASRKHVGLLIFLKHYEKLLCIVSKMF